MQKLHDKDKEIILWVGVGLVSVMIALSWFFVLNTSDYFSVDRQESDDIEGIQSTITDSFNGFSTELDELFQGVELEEVFVDENIDGEAGESTNLEEVDKTEVEARADTAVQSDENSEDEIKDILDKIIKE